jgi:hypothetical protein
MSNSNQLHTYEEILLLAMRDKKGTLFFGIDFPQAIAGALLSELFLLKRIKIEYKGKKKFAVILNNKPIGDLLLDECLGKIANSKRRVRLENWVSRFANITHLKRKAAQSLCRRGILKLEEKKVLLIFTQKVYPEIDPRPEKYLLDKMRKAIFGNQKNIDAEIVILIALCNNTGILGHLFDKHKLKEKKKWIKEITSGNLIGDATKEAVEAMQAAIMVAVIIPSAAVGVSS